MSLGSSGRPGCSCEWWSSVMVIQQLVSQATGTARGQSESPELRDGSLRCDIRAPSLVQRDYSFSGAYVID